MGCLSTKKEKREAGELKYRFNEKEESNTYYTTSFFILIFRWISRKHGRSKHQNEEPYQGIGCRAN